MVAAGLEKGSEVMVFGSVERGERTFFYYLLIYVLLLKLLFEFGREAIRLNRQNKNFDPCGI